MKIIIAAGFFLTMANNPAFGQAYIDTAVYVNGSVADFSGSAGTTIGSNGSLTLGKGGAWYFTNTILHTPRTAGSSNITFGDGSTYDNAEGGYVDGIVNYAGTADFILPTGDANAQYGGGYHPIKIGLPAGPAQFTAAYTFGATPFAGRFATNITAIDTNAYWACNGAGMAVIGISPRDLTGVFGGAPAFIAGYNIVTAQWEQLSDSSFTSGSAADLTLYSYFTAASNANALPVTLTDVTASLVGKEVQVTWTGYNEINMAGYDVEKSNDAYQFNKIGSITAKNNNALQNNYIFFDAAPLNGNNFYRIKSISKNAEVQYSKIVKVVVGNTPGGVQVYPNPVVNKTAQLRLFNLPAGNYMACIYASSGQRVLVYNYVHTGGSALVNIPLKAFSPGIYHIEVKNGTDTYYTKILVQ